MFAQQAMNNSRQPMGILASSPELMGAVQQRFSNGGFFDRMFPRYATSPVAKGLEFIAGEKFKKGGEGETLANIAQQSLQSQISPVIPGVDQTAVNPNLFEINRRLVSNTKGTDKGTDKGIDGEVTTSGDIEEQLKKSDEDKGVIDLESTPPNLDSIDVIINEQNEKGNNLKKKDKVADESKEKPDPLLKGTEFKELKDAKAKLQEIQSNINKPNPGAPIVSEFKGVLDQIQTELNKKQEELTVDEVDKLARRYAG